MAIRPDGTAPYAPLAAVMTVIEGFRDRGLSTPVTTDVLLRAGVKESLVTRTLKSLQDLELLEENGTPTERFEGLRRATSEGFQERMADLVRDAYGAVFSFVDPATADVGRIADAFRAYNPLGQRKRMVALFLGLCEVAGIRQADSRPVRPARAAVRTRTTKKKVPPTKTPPRDVQRPGPGSAGSDLPPALAGILAELPPSAEGWTEENRDRWLATFEAVLNFSIPVRQDALAETGEDDESSE